MPLWLKRTRVIAVLLAGTLSCSRAEAWAPHDASVSLAPLFGTLVAHGVERSFYTATGGAASHSYYFSPSFALETGYEAQIIGTTPVLHGPDVGMTVVLWGERAFSFSEDSLYLKVTQPLSLSVTVGGWYRFYSLKNLFPESVRTLEEYQDFVTPGSALGVAFSGSVRVQILDDVGLFLRGRYAAASTPEISGGSLKAYSLHIGVVTTL
jgi:hypothetical protein